MMKKNNTKTNSTKIQIIDADNDLENYLLSIKNKKIDIVVAFASKTEDLVQSILDNGNHLNLTIGSINYFSDPVFIKYCQGISKNDKYKKNFNFSVDFRGNDSVHWKVYLIAPDIVVIGSSNLTLTGISMIRDTAVIISDKQLYNYYQVLFASLKKYDGVLTHDSVDFDEVLSEYEKQHRKSLTRLLSTTTKNKPKHLANFSKWINQDSTQALPIFIWDDYLTKKDEKEFEQEIKPKIGLPNNENKKLSIVGHYKGLKKNQLHHNGDVLLHMNSNGAYIHFREVNICVYGKGKWWMCESKGKHMSIPFELSSDLKIAIKKNANAWYNEDKNYLDSNDLRNLQKALSKLQKQKK